MKLKRLKVVLVVRRWLKETLGKNEATVSRWCTNVFQPSLETLFTIAKELEMDMKDLLISKKI